MPFAQYFDEFVARREDAVGVGQRHLTGLGEREGAAGALELAGNLVSFDDHVCHATINVDELDPDCALTGLVLNQPREVGSVDVVLNNSFGMLGINSAVIIKRFTC